MCCNETLPGCDQTCEVEQEMQALRVLRNYNGSRSALSLSSHVMSISFLFMFLYRQTESEFEVSLSLFVALSEDGNSLASSSRPVSPFFHAGCEKKVQARTERRHSRTKGRMSRLARGARTEQHEPRGQHCIANAKNSALSM